MPQTATAKELIARSLQKRLKEELGCRSAYSDKLSKLYVHDLTVSCYLSFYKGTISLYILSDAGKYGKRLFNTVELGAIAGADNIADPVFNPELCANKLFEAFKFLKSVPTEIKRIYGS